MVLCKKKVLVNHFYCVSLLGIKFEKGRCVFFFRNFKKNVSY